MPTDTGLAWDRSWKDWQTFYKRYRRVVVAAGLPWVKRKTASSIRASAWPVMDAEWHDAG